MAFYLILNAIECEEADTASRLELQAKIGNREIGKTIEVVIQDNKKTPVKRSKTAPFKLTSNNNQLSLYDSSDNCLFKGNGAIPRKEVSNQEYTLTPTVTAPNCALLVRYTVREAENEPAS